MSLPLSRNTTYAALSQVKSDDLNAMQDCIIGAKHNTLRMLLPGSMWQDPNGTHTKSLSPAGAMRGYLLAASANKLTMPLPVLTGDTIMGFRVNLLKNTNGSATVAARLYSYDGTTETALGAGGSDAENAPGLTSFSELGLTITPVVGVQYILLLTPSASVTPAGDVVLSVELFKQRI